MLKEKSKIIDSSLDTQLQGLAPSLVSLRGLKNRG